MKRWGQDLDVGPFHVIEHVTFEEFVLTVDGQHHDDVVFDHAAAFAAWGPVVVELNLVHAIDDRLAAAYRIVPGAVSHVSWVVPDLAAEGARLAGLGCRLINTAEIGTDRSRLARRRTVVRPSGRAAPAQRRHRRPARPPGRAARLNAQGHRRRAGPAPPVGHRPAGLGGPGRSAQPAAVRGGARRRGRRAGYPAARRGLRLRSYPRAGPASAARGPAAWTSAPACSTSLASGCPTRTCARATWSSCRSATARSTR